MIFLFALLTVILVLVSSVLILLVLVQLPKKDAGTGISFGGAAADALFGAGSGNVLTKITAWTTGIFFLIIIALSWVHDNLGSDGHDKDFARKVAAQQQSTAPVQVPAPVVQQPAVTPANTNTFRVFSAPSSAPAPGAPVVPANKN